MAAESSSNCKQPKKTSRTLLPEDSQLLPNLPSEIIVEILLRLPVKSLLRFRCISKSWRSLISQPKFAKTHLSLASMNTAYTHHRLILSGLYPGEDSKSCSLYSILNEQSDTDVELDFPMKGPLWEKIVGWCDCLVCIANGGEVFIWNPSTRKYKRLPVVEKLYDSSVTYGFGYDESADDYKVAQVVHYLGTGGLEVEVKVYNLRTDSWRRIEDFPDSWRGIGDFPHHHHLDGLGTHSNGVLHWFASTESDVIIVSLDLAKETYGEVSEPDYQNGYMYRNLLDVLNGCLCILCTYNDRADLWVMKEYGIRESWTKFVVIPYATHPFVPSSELVCIWKNGEVLLHTRKYFFLYNAKERALIYPRIRNCSESSTVVCPYVEGLVSPDIDADNGVQWQHQF